MSPKSTVLAAPKTCSTVLDHVGRTPLVKLNKIPKEEGVDHVDIYVKCEFFNAGGSVKDRIAKRMIEEAEKAGIITPGVSTVIEPTSGNTGIGLALAAAIKGYRCIITLPEKMSQEKVDVLKALGAEIIRTPTEAAWDAPESHIGVAKRLNKEIPNSVILDQYGNPNNPLAHYYGTAEEILEQLEGKVDMYVAGAGTGGTLSGTAKRLKEVCPDVKIVGLDPVGSILALPESLNGSVTSYKTEDRESFLMARRLIRHEGLLCGGSSGTAMAGAIKAIKQANLPQGSKVVVILPDSVRNYMTKFLRDSWMKENGFISAETVAEEERRLNQFRGATIKDLGLPTAVTADTTTPCREAVLVMQKNGFDQLPVVDASTKAIVGLVTLGNILSRVSSHRASLASPVETVMFHFNTKDKKFHEITPKTPLADLSAFFEKNSAGVVTEPEVTKSGDKVHKVVSVVTKIDLMAWLVQHGM
ncbi:tryptophan synthase beta subunit-like PLP-dependent enzyme [Catenaria anguillulae PL171]|uniref:cystathionine beta-synthase n=1 Tax=Catenaria anguillulae PL171 TaxID=765915 RepID=A0A1Y2H4M2_9FUNG|nr:tryptophan synthase beta subunit-like PLP-dependent enzyme [Catenaria anguillulae PL171]